MWTHHWETPISHPSDRRAISEILPQSYLFTTNSILDNYNKDSLSYNTLEINTRGNQYCSKSAFTTWEWFHWLHMIQHYYPKLIEILLTIVTLITYDTAPLSWGCWDVLWTATILAVMSGLHSNLTDQKITWSQLSLNKIGHNIVAKWTSPKKTWDWSQAVTQLFVSSICFR